MRFIRPWFSLAVRSLVCVWVRGSCASGPSAALRLCHEFRVQQCLCDRHGNEHRERHDRRRRSTDWSGHQPG